MAYDKGISTELFKLEAKFAKTDQHAKFEIDRKI